MAISKDLEIKINGDQASFSKKFYIYQNDRGINLNIKVSISKLELSKKLFNSFTLEYTINSGSILVVPISSIIFCFKFIYSTNSTSLLSDLDGAFCGAIILKPNGEVIGRENIEVSDEVIKFTIDHELTDELDEIGVYKIQFHLYDGSDNRITIPPVEFEVKGLLGIVPNSL